MNEYLLDVSVLVAFSEPKHRHYLSTTRWFAEYGNVSWGTCAFSEAGFIRVMTHRGVSGRTVEDCTRILKQFADHPGYRFWPITSRWVELIAPFKERVIGHQQVTDAYLLGLVIQENGVLVTLDKGLRYLAGSQYAQHLLLIT